MAHVQGPACRHGPGRADTRPSLPPVTPLYVPHNLRRCYKAVARGLYGSVGTRPAEWHILSIAILLKSLADGDWTEYEQDLIGHGMKRIHPRSWQGAGWDLICEEWERSRARPASDP